MFNALSIMNLARQIAERLYGYEVLALECDKVGKRIESQGGDASNMLGAARAYRQRLKDIEGDIQEILDNPTQTATV